mmetsp:Transcript_14244/g.38891  ORF Transcript_14244/g.38891 Transcript_14244/m.38891 type:complete len:93 (-) Transcript_14244:165-443(-)
MKQMNGEKAQISVSLRVLSTAMRHHHQTENPEIRHQLSASQGQDFVDVWTRTDFVHPRNANCVDVAMSGDSVRLVHHMASMRERETFHAAPR